MQIPEKPWQGKSDELLKNLETNKNGLTNIEAQKRILHFGANSISRRTPFPYFQIIFDQFVDLLVLLLVVAAVLSFILGDLRNGFIISLIILLNAGIGFVQEFKAEKILKALRQLLPANVEVRREGKEKQIPANYLVPGDIVILDEGDTVPADIRIIEAYDLSTDEKILTGESSNEVKNSSNEIENPPLHEMKNMVFMGTTVASGEAVGVVVRTGFNTEFGKIASRTISIDKTLSPLQEKTHRMAKTIALIAVIIMIFLIIFYYFTRHDILNALIFSVAVAAALVPEGLPATISVALSIGARNMARRRALAKNLVSIETLGSTTIICTDKTGTLTTGKMTVKEIWQNSKNGFEKERNQELINQVLVLCNDAEIGEKNEVGDPLEISLLLWVKEKNIDIQKLRNEFSKVNEIPFSATRRYMESVYQKENEKHEFVKGAPEVVLEMCDKESFNKEEVVAKYQEMQKQGFRVLALCYNKKFLGLAAIFDPPRNEVPEAISKCQKGGIRVIMITGDGALTAASIAKMVGIVKTEEAKVIEGSVLEKMSDLELRNNLNDVNVFARILPEQKYRIVDTLMKMGETVAATGDGVNDAPALKRADIGVSMGENGTDVSREASDLILLDDNFATIAQAVDDGRVIFDNIKKFLFFIFTHNFGELLITLLGFAFGLPLPLLPVQILAIDLGTDVLPSMSLIAEKGENVMQTPPRSKKTQLLTREALVHLGLLGTIIGFGSIINFISVLNVTGNYPAATTVAFSTLVGCQLFNIFLSRCPKTTIFKYPFFSNVYVILAAASTLILLLAMVYTKFFNKFLYTGSFPSIYWLRILLVGIVFLIFEEMYKLIKYKYFLKNEKI